MSLPPPPSSAQWPAWEHELLLRAALDHGPAAAEAWRQWRAAVSYEHLDQASYRLLPLVYRRMRQEGIQDPLLGFMRGVHRRTWHDNHLLFHRAQALLRAFHAAGIPTLILKGPALTLLYYRDYGLRPMGDFDILTPTAQAHAALRLMSEQGFKASLYAGKPFKPVYVAVINAFGFVDGQGTEVDLHWHLLHECCWPDADEPFWAGAIPVMVGDTPSLALQPADQLLHTCVHGLRWNPMPSVRWVADAVTLLRAAPDLDWTRLVSLAQRLELVIILREALTYLHGKWAAPVPPDVLARLDGLPVSPGEPLEYAVTTRPPESLGPLLRLRAHYRRYRRTFRPRWLGEQPLGFARYLQYSWGLESVGAVPRYALRWATRWLSNVGQ